MATCSSADEEVHEAAEHKYKLFEETNKELLDPSLTEELELMKQLGLPTRLINRFEVCYSV